MRARTSRRVPRGPAMRAIVSGMLGIAVLLVLGACEDTKIVEVERPFFDDPPAQAGNFLGYSNEARKLTVCGNCHIGQQSEWEETAHADAWATLQASPGAQPFCETCHTVSQNGNATTEPGGWETTEDPRYHDVQCESCHGPGETHVSNPDASQPQASIAVGTDLTTGCAECHSGNHHPFAEEWERSAHSGVIGFAAARPECQSCHRGQGTLLAWGVNDEFVEKNASEPQPVVCAVCHDPHDATNEGQLRFPVQTASVEQHLCARCHNRRTSPDPDSRQGLAPHSPETALLQGDAGWFPPNSQIDQGQIRGTHGSAANERLCATCHVAKFEIEDQETGEFVFNATGHLFTAIPCLDADGIPVGGDCEVTAEARAFNGCTGGACHGDQIAAATVLNRSTERIERLVEELEDLLVQVDPNLDGPGGAIDANDPTFTVAEGAFFNVQMARFGGSFRGTATHNPFLIEALLIASVDAVEEEFGVVAASRSNWDAELQEVLSRAR